MTRLLLLAVVSVAILSGAAAQPADTLHAAPPGAVPPPPLSVVVPPPPPTAYLIVDAAGAEAVYVSAPGYVHPWAVTLGPFAPGEVIVLSPGEGRAAALASATAWSGPRAETGISLVLGDTARVTLTLPVRYRVETLPLGAAVTLESPGAAPRALGAAPLAVDLPAGATGTVTARLDGYADARAMLDGTGGPVALVLRPGDAAEGVVPVVLLPTQRSPRTRTLIDVGIGALAFAAGAVAVHYKFQADRIDDRYRNPDSPERGSETLRMEAERLDVRSGIALGAMQAGVGVLALRFILR